MTPTMKQYWKIKSENFDLLFTSIAMNNNSTKSQILNSTNFFKILISKSSYFVTKDCASKILDFMTKIRFSYKINLSYFINENKSEIKSLIFNRNILFEGSKIGLFSTSINNNNYLYQNCTQVKQRIIYTSHKQQKK